MELVLFFAVFVSIVCGEGQEYYVSSNNATVSCFERPCYSFQYYCNNYQQFFVDDTTFYFMEGTHCLDKSYLLLIEGISNITLKGMNYSLEEGSHETIRQPTVFIDCYHSNSGFIFHNCSKVSIIGITFVNCGSPIPDDITKNILPMEVSSTQYSLTNNFLTLGMISTKLITLHEISIQKSIDLGLMCINALNVSVTYSSFAYNNLANYTNCTKINSCSGGNALFIYTSMEQCQDHFYIYYTNITYSNFSFGFDNSIYKPSSASGLTLILIQGDHYGVDVRIKKLVLFGNSGIVSGNFYYLVSQYVAYQSLFISNCTSIYGNAIHLLKHNKLFDFIDASSFSVCLCLPAYTSSISKCFKSLTSVLPKIPVVIQHSQFIHNIGPNGAGLTLQGLGRYPCIVDQGIIIESCQMVNNSGLSGASLNIFFFSANILIRNVSIIKSQLSHMYSSISISQLKSAILIDEIMNIAFINVIVSDNAMSGMMISKSTVTFIDYNLFINNKAEDGAGLFINEKSIVGLQSPVKLVFENNTASKRGGAIYVNINPFLSRNACFMRPYSLNFQNTSVIFKNNDAMTAGSAIYGGYIDTCYFILLNNDTEYSIVNGTVWFESIFYFINQTGLSVISSNPEKICFCLNSGIIDCTLRALNFSLLPGQFQSINIVTIGQREGVSPGIITISEQIQGSAVTFRQSYESTKTKCTSIKYYPHVNVSMASSHQVVRFSLQEQDPHMKYIFFNFEECPLGFELSPVTSSCDCISYININESLTCNPYSESFYHQGDMWIGYVEESHCFISKLPCKSQHCKMNPVNFTLSTTEKQCDLNRSGLLCGGCNEGLSMMLGSDSCGECSDNWLALLILFAVAGIVLIVFITALNLTVSVGSINGLIFYANIVKMKELLLIPSQSTFLKVFISWLNLDLGIEMCFYDGMTTFHKMLLQFLFPVYLWLLIILVIILSHYSFKVSRLMGRHAISVLATVLLFSFTKIFRLCISAMNPVKYTCEPGDQTIVAWSMDARIMYFSQKHLFLLVPALAAVILLVLPYTLLILFSPLVERYISKYKCCQCWVKLKPLFDAYNGPYNDKYRSWTGFLLLIRCLLVFVFAYNDPNTSVMALIIVSGFLLSIIGIFNGIYQRKINNFLECFFLFDLLLLATRFTSSSSSTSVFSSISLSLAFIVFVLIILCHLVQTKMFKKVKDYLQKKSKLKKNRFPSNIPMLQNKLLDDNKHVEIEDASFELYKEDGSFVLRKRESLICEGSIDI